MDRGEATRNYQVPRAAPERQVQDLLQTHFRPASVSEEFRERLIRESLNILSQSYSSAAQHPARRHNGEPVEVPANPLDASSTEAFRRRESSTGRVNRLTSPARAPHEDRSADVDAYRTQTFEAAADMAPHRKAGAKGERDS